jgi:hypothetical protein
MSITECAYLLLGVAWFVVVWRWRWNGPRKAKIAAAMAEAESMFEPGVGRAVVSTATLVVSLLMITLWPVHAVLAAWLWRRR